MVHQRGHLTESGVHPPDLLPPPTRPRPRDPGAHHPEPLRHVDPRRELHHLGDLIGHLRGRAAVRLHAVSRAIRLRLRALPRGHRRLAFLRKPAGRGCPGDETGETESDRRARSDSTPAREIAPSARTFFRAPRHQARYGVTGSTPPSSAPAARPPGKSHQKPANQMDSAAPAGHPGTGHGAGPGARAAHLSPATPARDHPQPLRRPSFAGTPRRQPPGTFLTAT